MTEDAQVVMSDPDTATSAFVSYLKLYFITVFALLCNATMMEKINSY